jgi:two-component system, response regulator YesN
MLCKKEGVCEMYNLMIVDDEDFVRDGLKEYVKWDEMGFNVVFDTDSAENAMEILENERIEVVLTDIMMPDVDGLELISKIKKLNPDVFTLILSGYGEFEYAQKALRLGAVDFLTKPVDFEEICRVFSKIKRMLDHAKKNKNIQEEYLKYLSEQFFNNLVKGSYTDDKVIRRKAEAINLDLRPGFFRVLRFYITGIKLSGQENSDSKEYIDIKSIVLKIIEENLEKMGACYAFNNDIKELTAMIFCNINREKLDEGIKQLKEIINKRIDCIIHIGIGKGYEDILYITNSYYEAGKALEYKVLKKQSSILYYEDVASFFTVQSVVTEENRAVILSYLSQMDLKNLLEYTKTILNAINMKEKINVNQMYNSCLEIFLIINKYIHHGVDVTKNMEEDDNMTVRDLLQRESIDEIVIFMERYIAVSMEKIKNFRGKAAGRIIENAIKYIREHFNEEITLNKLSEVLFVHPVYICRLFKEELGENFIDYMKKIRIEKSKELLSNLSLKVYEVSEMIGYESPKYFSKLFKEITGITPKEYQDNIVGI